MPVTQTYRINALDLGQAERNRLQAQTIVSLLWDDPKTQDVRVKLRRATALDHPMRQLRTALRRQGPLDNIKSADLALFEAIVAKRKTIGNTLSDHVRSIFGKYVPWIAAELVACFITQVQASACGKQITRQSHVHPTELPKLEVSLPVGATMRERKAVLRRSTKIILRNLPTHRGRVPKLKAPSLARDAAWYYRCAVGKHTPYQLAKEYIHTQRSGMMGDYNANALVLRGIRLTAKRLDLPDPTKKHQST